MNTLRRSPRSENTGVNYHQSMFWIYIEKHSHEVTQHLMPAVKEFTAFKILSSSFLPSVCDKATFYFESKHMLFIAFMRSLSHSIHSG